jgi:hypothetical protein
MQLYCSVDHGHWQGLIEGVRRSNKEVVRIIIDLVYLSDCRRECKCWLWSISAGYGVVAPNLADLQE